MSNDDFYGASFEAKMQMLMASMTEKQKKENREQVQFMCKGICGKCPSYLGSGEKKFAFCMEGKSSNISKKKECLCKQCPIAKMMGLRWSYYCVDGSAIEISKRE